MYLCTNEARGMTALPIVAGYKAETTGSERISVVIIPFVTTSDALAQRLLLRLQQSAERNERYCAALHQTPTELWRHRNAITEYQVWVCYRMALHQLNLYSSGRELNNCCRKLPVCRGQKETLDHTFWGCPVAQGCWRALITYWTGCIGSPARVQLYARFCLSRKSPPLTPVISRRLLSAFGHSSGAYVCQWKRMWWILCSICITTLWVQRNRIVTTATPSLWWAVSTNTLFKVLGNYAHWRCGSIGSYTHR